MDTFITGDSYTVRSLAANTTYWFQVGAYGDGRRYRAIWSDWSSPDSATTGTITLPDPPAPTGLTATASGTSSVDLSWSSANGIDRYWVQRESSRIGPWTTVDTFITGDSYTVRSLAANTTYWFQVRAYGDGMRYAADWSNWSSPDSATTDPPIPAPAKMRPPDVTPHADYLEVSWMLLTGTPIIMFYEVRHKLESDPDVPSSWTATPIPTLHGDGYEDRNLSMGTYVVQIKACAAPTGDDLEYNCGAWSDSSEPVTIGEPPPAPTNLRANRVSNGFSTDATSDDITLRWESPREITSFEVHYTKEMCHSLETQRADYSSDNKQYDAKCAPVEPWNEIPPITVEPDMDGESHTREKLLTFTRPMLQPKELEHNQIVEEALIGNVSVMVKANPLYRVRVRAVSSSGANSAWSDYALVFPTGEFSPTLYPAVIATSPLPKGGGTSGITNRDGSNYYQYTICTDSITTVAWDSGTGQSVAVLSKQPSRHGVLLSGGLPAERTSSKRHQNRVERVLRRATFASCQPNEWPSHVEIVGLLAAA